MAGTKNEVAEVTVLQNEDIKTVITNFILAHEWKNVYVMGAVGSVIGMVFTAPIQNHLPLRCGKTPVHGAAEVVSMCGEVMPIEFMDPDLEDVYPDKDSPLFVHIHAACATAGGHVFGGGISAGKAFRALRVFMIHLDDSKYE